MREPLLSQQYKQAVKAKYATTATVNPKLYYQIKHIEDLMVGLGIDAGDFLGFTMDRLLPLIEEEGAWDYPHINLVLCPISFDIYQKHAFAEQFTIEPNDTEEQLLIRAAPIHVDFLYFALAQAKAQGEEFNYTASFDVYVSHIAGTPEMEVWFNFISDRRRSKRLYQYVSRLLAKRTELFVGLEANNFTDIYDHVMEKSYGRQ